MITIVLKWSIYQQFIIITKIQSEKIKRYFLLFFSFYNRNIERKKIQSRKTLQLLSSWWNKINLETFFTIKSIFKSGKIEGKNSHSHFVLCIYLAPRLLGTCLRATIYYRYNLSYLSLHKNNESKGNTPRIQLMQN